MRGMLAGGAVAMWQTGSILPSCSSCPRRSGNTHSQRWDHSREINERDPRRDVHLWFVCHVPLLFVYIYIYFYSLIPLCSSIGMRPPYVPTSNYHRGGVLIGLLNPAVQVFLSFWWLQLTQVDNKLRAYEELQGKAIFIVPNYGVRTPYGEEKDILLFFKNAGDDRKTQFYSSLIGWRHTKGMFSTNKA